MWMLMTFQFSEHSLFTSLLSPFTQDLIYQMKSMPDKLCKLNLSDKYSGVRSSTLFCEGRCHSSGLLG